MDTRAARDDMLLRLREGGVRDERVLEAMAAVPREEFVLPGDRAQAYADRALPIGSGQTISQPLMVALIVEALELAPGEVALDVGTGSGYQAAVMAACGAHVVSIERVEALAYDASERLRRFGMDVEVVVGDGSLGAPGHGLFDGIAVGAAAPRLPIALARQLRNRGRLVVPISTDWEGELLTRLRVVDGVWHTESLGPCRFVRLIGADAYAPPQVP
jgi:protein-L-isoaspartate(D-aspartate) O-methyltransferase